MSIHLHILSAAALLVALTAAVTDVKTGLIPNRLVIAALLVGVFGNLIGLLALHGTGGLLAALLQGVGGALSCALVPLFLFCAGGLAGGDVKLFIALGSLLGPALGLQAQLYAFVAGALYVFGLLAYDGALLRTVGASFVQVASAVFPKRARIASTPETTRTIRFAPAIFVGAAIAVVSRWTSL